MLRQQVRQPRQPIHRRRRQEHLARRQAPIPQRVRHLRTDAVDLRNLGRDPSKRFGDVGRNARIVGAAQTMVRTKHHDMTLPQRLGRQVRCTGRHEKCV